MEALIKVFQDEGVVFLEATDAAIDGVAIRPGSPAAAKALKPGDVSDDEA